MARYRVEHRYASSTHGPWVEGDHVELDEDQAAWVNHDSQGTLKLVDPQEQARQKREKQEEDEAKRKAQAAQATETSAPPAPKRRGRPPGSGTARKAT